MSQMISVALDVAQSSVLTGIGVRPLTEKERTGVLSVARIQYERLHAQALRNREELVGLNELADPTEVTRLITKAENLVEKNPSGACNVLMRGQQIFLAQKLQAEQRRIDKGAYQTALNTAQQALTRLKSTANAAPLPLEDLILAAQGLAERGQYAAAKAKLDGHAKVLKTQQDKALAEPGKQRDFTTQLQLAQRALTELQSDDLKEHADPSELEQRIETAKVHQAAGRYASALEALGEHKKLSDGLLKTAREAKTKKDEYTRRAEVCKNLIAGFSTNTFADTADLLIMSQNAASLAGESKYAEAVKALAKAEKVAGDIRTKADTNRLKQSEYTTKLNEVRSQLAELKRTAPLTDPAPLEQCINEAGIWAGKNQFVDALKTLGKAGDLVARQNKKAEKGRPGMEQYQRDLRAAQDLRTELAKKELATTAPLDQIILLAKSAADGGNFELASKALKDAPRVAEEQTSLADAEKTNKTVYENMLRLAERGLESLAPFVPLADPTALQKKITTAKGLAGLGKYASAAQALAGYDSETAEQKNLGRMRQLAKGQYDGKLSELKIELAKIKSQNHKKLIIFGINQADALAQQNRYDEAVTQIDNQLEFARTQVSFQRDQETKAAEYQRLLTSADEKVARLVERDREELTAPARDIMAGATQQAAEGKYDRAIGRMSAAHSTLDSATLAADLDDQKQPLYVSARAAADNEIAQLLNSTKATSPERLQQMVQEAEAFANLKRYTEAYAAIESHTTLFNELKTLGDSEAGKSGKYPSKKADAQKDLLKLRAEELVDAEGVKEAEDLLALAEKQAGEGKFASAIATLLEFKTVCVRVTGDAERARKVRDDNAKYGPKYRQRLEECTTLLNELKTLPGAEDAVAKLAEKLRLAGAEEKKNDLKAASRALKGAADKAREAKTGSAKAVDDVGKTSGTFSKDYGSIKNLTKEQITALTNARNAFQTARGKAETALGLLRGIALTDEIAGIEKRITDATAMAVAAGQERAFTAGLGKITTATTALNKIAEEASTRQTHLDDTKRQSAEFAGRLQILLQELWQNARAEEVAPFDERFKSAQNLIALKKFEDADAIFKALEPRLAKKHGDITKDMALWTAADLKLTTTESGLSKYDSVPALVTNLQSIRDQVAALRSMRVGQEKNYRLAAEEAGYILDQTAMFDEVKRLYEAFEDARDEAKDTVEEEDALVGTALDSLKDAMTNEAKGARAPTDLVARREAVLAEWEKRLAVAFNDTSLGLEVTVDALRKIATEAKEREKDPGAANKNEEQRMAREAFEAARDNCQKAVVALRSRAGKEAAPYEEEMQSLLDRAEFNWVKATTDTNLLRARVQQQATDLEDARNAAAVKARARAAAATTEIDTLQKGLKKFFALTNDLGDEFAKYFEAAKTQIAGLDGMRNSGNLQTIAAADKELDAIMVRVRVAAADARNTTPGERSFKAVVDLRKTLQEALDKAENTKKCLPTEYARITKEWKELTDKLTAMEPGAAHDALKAFQDSLIPVSQASIKAARQRAELKRAVEKANTDVDKLKKTAPTYYESLAKQIKKAQADGKKERGEAAALTLLKTLQAEIDKALDPARTTAIDLAGKEKTCREDAAALKNAKANWESSLNVFEGTALKNAQSAVAGHPEGDKSQIDGLKDVRDKAKEAAKMGDYVGAVKQLQTATKMAQRIIAAPQGLRNSSRDNLAGVGTRWRSAAEQVNAAILDVADKLTKLSQTETIKNVESIINLLKGLVTGPLAFNATAFDSTITTLSKKNNALAERRAAREAGMRFVRQYKDRLKDPVLMVLFTNNPFGNVPLNLAHAALDDLDLNIQRCV